LKAIVQRLYGPPDAPGVLELAEVARPEPGDEEVLVKVHASSVNALEWHRITGLPMLLRLSEGLRRPKSGSIGSDFSGTVEAVGAAVSTFRPGDEVFGARTGAYAEYLCVRHDRGIVHKPSGAGFEEAASIGVAATTALQALRDKGHVQPGQAVLINGASGGVGTFAVQVAKALGAEVTAVCSTGNVDIARRSGADHVVDYTREDFTRGGRRFPLMIDVNGARSWSDCRRVLTEDATCVIVGSPADGALLGPLRHTLGQLLGALGSKRKVVSLFASINQATMESLRAMLAEGTLRPVVDRRYSLSETAAAVAELGRGHARGKIVITVP